MQTMVAFVDCEYPPSDDDIYNGAREALARAGFQIGDLTVTNREGYYRSEVTVETTAPARTRAVWGSFRVDVALPVD